MSVSICLCLCGQRSQCSRHQEDKGLENVAAVVPPKWLTKRCKVDDGVGFHQFMSSDVGLTNASFKQIYCAIRVPWRRHSCTNKSIKVTRLTDFTDFSSLIKNENKIWMFHVCLSSLELLFYSCFPRALPPPLTPPPIWYLWRVSCLSINVLCFTRNTCFLSNYPPQ